MTGREGLKGEGHGERGRKGFKSKYNVAFFSFCPPVVGHVLLSSKTYFTKISVKGGPCNIHILKKLAYRIRELRKGLSRKLYEV